MGRRGVGVSSGLMMVAVLVSETAAEAGVAAAVRVDVMVVVMVEMTMTDVYGNLYVVRDWLLDGDRDVLLDMDWVWTIDGHLDRVGDWSVDGVRNVLLNGVGLRYGNLDWIWHGLLDMHWVWSVDGNLHFVGGSLLYDVWNGTVDGHWYRSGHSNLVRSVDGHGNLVWDLLLNGVRLGNGHFNLNWVRHVLDHFVGLRYGHLDFVRDLLDDFVGLGNVDLYFVGAIDRYMDGVGDFLLNRVRLWHMYGNLDVLLDGVRNMFDNFVGLRNGHLDWIRHMLLYGVRDVFLHGVRHWVSLQQGDGLMDVRMATQIDTVTVSVTVRVMIVHDGFTVVIGAAQVSAAQITNIEPIDAVAVAQIEQTTFVELLLKRHGRLGAAGVLLARLGDNGRGQQKCRNAHLWDKEKN